MKSIGIDFGGTSIKFGVVQGKDIIAKAPPIIPKDFPEPEDLIGAIAATVNQLKSEHPKIVATGCGVPGFVDFPTKSKKSNDLQGFYPPGLQGRARDNRATKTLDIFNFPRK